MFAPRHLPEDSLMLFLKEWPPQCARHSLLKPVPSSQAFPPRLAVCPLPAGWGGGASLLLRKFINSFFLLDSFWGLGTPTIHLMTYICWWTISQLHFRSFKRCGSGAIQTLVLSFVFRRFWIVYNEGGRKDKLLFSAMSFSCGKMTVLLKGKWKPCFIQIHKQQN